MIFERDCVALALIENTITEPNRKIVATLNNVHRYFQVINSINDLLSLIHCFKLSHTTFKTVLTVSQDPFCYLFIFIFMDFFSYLNEIGPIWRILFWSLPNIGTKYI